MKVENLTNRIILANHKTKWILSTLLISKSPIKKRLKKTERAKTKGANLTYLSSTSISKGC